jgi:DNA polymerase-1
VKNLEMSLSMSEKKELYIIDGHALAYRAYFGMIRTPLTNSKGQPTGAVFGFANYMLRMLHERECPYLTVIFDSGKPSHRKEIFQEYKANRSAMPDELISQIPLIFTLVDCLNIPYFVKDHIEADDIIAYLAQKAAREGFRVYVVTKDKDLMQLVTESIHVLAPESGGGFIDMGPAQVQEKMGVAPEKILDLLSLMGDASDNIPGVEGVGPKTAIKILEEAGSIDNLLTNPQCIGNLKLRRKLIDHRENIILSKRLATLNNDAGVDIDLAAIRRQALRIEQCREFFTAMEFSSLLKNPLFSTQREIDFSVIVPKTLQEVRDIAGLIGLKGFVSVDTETTDIEPRSAKLVGISIALETGKAWYIPVGHDEGENLDCAEVLAILKPVLESLQIKKIGQNLKYDYQIFKNYGIVMRGIWFDTLIAAYLIEPGKRLYNLDALAQEWLNLKTIPIGSLIGKGKDQKSFATTSIGDAARYSGEDAVIPLRLLEKFEPLLEEKNQKTLFEEVEIPLIAILAEMEWHGIALDTGILNKLSGEYGQNLDLLSKEIYAMAGEEFNLNSPKQISDILFSKLALPKSKKTKTGLSTDVDALEKLALHSPIAQKLLDYREVQKLLSTYINALPQQINSVSGKIHTSFNQTVVATGRLSSTSPNLQNIPVRTDIGRKIREAFVALPGYSLISADYSQIELRILAHLSNDSHLIQTFKDDKDVHTQTASAMYGVFPGMVTPQMRYAAKAINFGLMYGMGPMRLSQELHISFHEAQTFIDKYFEQFPTIRRFMDATIENARSIGYSQTLLGRRRYLPDINAENRQVRESAERIAINTPVQGTAADIIKIAMINIFRELHVKFPDATMLLQVHDELVFHAPTDLVEPFKKWVIDMMSNAFVLSVPLKVDAGYGKNWSEAH